MLHALSERNSAMEPAGGDTGGPQPTATRCHSVATKTGNGAGADWPMYIW